MSTLFHDGETKMHTLMHVPPQMNPASSFLTRSTGYLLQQCPLLALGTVDSQNRPWTTLWGGSPGFARPLPDSMLSIDTRVDTAFDPVVDILLRGKHGKSSPMVSGLTLDLESRSRAKFYGRMTTGALLKEKAQLVVHVEESLGNCPKYMNEKFIVPAIPNPKLLSDSCQLPSEAVLLLNKADMFFMSTSHGTIDMDTNHRGGPPGFVRLVSNDASGAILVYPEFSGNRLYSTMGNLQTTPMAGLVVPDFITGDVLYLTGRTEVLTGGDAAAVLPRSNLVVRIQIIAARFVEKGLPFTGPSGELSPYNPPVRYLPSEKQTPELDSKDMGSPKKAVLVNSHLVAPSIMRLRFRIKDASTLQAWRPGQYVALAFAGHLDRGYSHMRDQDPRSLNDDLVRTFTVSNAPSKEAMTSGKVDSDFEITIRKVGKATTFLFEQKPSGRFEIDVLGFGGNFQLKDGEHILPFIAGGIGITPVLGQFPILEKPDSLRLIWCVHASDLGLVVDTFRQHPNLIKSTTLFLTGEIQEADPFFRAVIQSDVRVQRRRVQENDLRLLECDGAIVEWYVCAGSGLKSQVSSWLPGKRVISEDFGFS